MFKAAPRGASSGMFWHGTCGHVTWLIYMDLWSVLHQNTKQTVPNTHGSYYFFPWTYQFERGGYRAYIWCVPVVSPIATWPFLFAVNPHHFYLQAAVAAAALPAALVFLWLCLWLISFLPRNCLCQARRPFHVFFSTPGSPCSVLDTCALVLLPSPYF